MSTLRAAAFGVALLTAAVLTFGVALSVCLAGCAAAPPIAEVTPAAAEGAYTAELLRCVDQSQTREQSRTCRAGVDRKWGVDAGKDSSQ